MLAYSVLGEVSFSGSYIVASSLSFYTIFPRGVHVEKEREGEKGALVPSSSSY